MRNVFTIGLSLLLASWSPAAEPALQRFTFSEPHMGTRFKIVLYAPDEATANAAAKAAFQRIADLDATMSDYRVSSELMQLCRKAGGEPVTVSDDLYRVLAKAQEFSKLSDGAFDVTISPLVRLWRLARRTQQLPNAEDLAKAKALVGYQHMKLDAAARTVHLLKTGMLLDLGGIAKGYAADAALAVLKKHGITRALVAAGGDIAVSGPPPDAGGWKIGIQPLEGSDAEPSRYLLLKDAAVSTSGDAEQFVVIDGKRYSHIVDPKTGLGLLGRMSVTVVAPNGLTADALAKIPSVLGAERGLALVEQIDGVAALFVKKTDKGDEVVESKRFKSFLAEAKP
ncbi:MAG: FAD:protein FMN transferase [Planctomycetia bacterium]|nr:FAD:protein FMN transferase [Planctomycetia bacterium]